MTDCCKQVIDQLAMSDKAKEDAEDMAQKALEPEYCDYIADAIRKELAQKAGEGDTPMSGGSVSHVEFDLHPQLGYFLSSKKTVRATDANGKSYKITVEVEA